MDNLSQKTKKLVAHSIDVIKRGQSPDGGYVACPNFGQYTFCWYRDGSFTAHAMSVMGETASATQFHDWAARTALANAHFARECISRANRGEPIDTKRILRTRYPLTEPHADDDWPNFQLDGFGTWLWAAIDHLRRSKDAQAAARWRPALDLVAEYLAALWRLPNHDCWEENGDRVNITTLVALYGGLNAYALHTNSAFASAAAHNIRTEILARGVCNGHLRKFVDEGCEVDAALIGAAVPYALFDVQNPIMNATAQKIERDLRRGGVHRYATDSYYGGGEWILLTAWLGWHYAAAGDIPAAQNCLDWIVNQADDNLELPEQVAQNLIAPEKLPEWQARWGEVAKPLLWSHAQFLILWQALNKM